MIDSNETSKKKGDVELVFNCYLCQHPVIKHTDSELTSNTRGWKYQLDLPVDNMKAGHMEMKLCKRCYDKEKKKGEKRDTKLLSSSAI